MSEEEAISRAKLGDSDAMGHLFTTHRKLVFGRCSEMLKNTEEAEDLTQEVFLLVWQRIKQFKGDSAFSSWLYKITTNRVLQHIRVVGRMKTESELPENGRSGGQHQRAEINQAMSRLEPQDRDFMELKLAGYRSKEIPSNLSANHVRHHIRKANQFLREQLG